MSFTDDFLSQAAFKKLFGLAHTELKTFPLGNEANPSQITIMASDVYAESIPTTAAYVSDRIINCTNSTDAQPYSYLTVAQNLTVAPDGSGEGHPYLVTVPAGHGLIGQINPLTGSAYAQGDIVMSIIPKKFGETYRPILYDATKTEITPLNSADWIIDERGFVIIRDNTTPPAYLSCYVYVGKTVSDTITTSKNVAITFVMDGGGSVLTTGVQGFIEIPFACTLSSVTLLADTTGSIVIDIWKDVYASYPPTNADSIILSGGTLPTISGGLKYQDMSLTGWNTTVSAGNILGFNIDSVDVITKCTLVLKAIKT